MAQIQIKDAGGSIQNAALVSNTGQAARTDSMPVTFSTEDMAAFVPGLSGGIVNTSNTTPVVGNFKTLQAITDVVFSALAETGATGSLTGVTISTGTVLSGTFTGYTLTSGVVRAYP